MSLSSLPHTLWHLYLNHLVYYEQGSWVDKIASTFRVLAFAMIAPFIILTLLDVASYVIARTLGVIDETKASTSGSPETTKSRAGQPTIVVSESISLVAATPLRPLPPELSEEDVDGNLKLSGVDTFSPAPSQPGSPTLQRREFMQHSYAHYGLGASLQMSPSNPDSDVSSILSFSLSRNADGGRAEAEKKDGYEDGDASAGGGGATTPRDPGSSSGESSYAMLDRDSGSEDAGVVLRRRTRPPGTGAGAGPDAEDGVA
ncbi:hypothetical protein L226DRAFT_535703 [Lentinus tigrinus ALCF2SS1-7]|uniref:uncharacterized protein n=1 Tax=Lentinus tigrinus ALCF2SS1-7 TaxID=1328758 RepID=UPI00116623CD|nr:hypothetical protein L226DRAFT_535703 [Lentinus tigrinus ALCF2SS1-7]